MWTSIGRTVKKAPPTRFMDEDWDAVSIYVSKHSGSNGEAYLELRGHSENHLTQKSVILYTDFAGLRTLRDKLTSFLEGNGQ